MGSQRTKTYTSLFFCTKSGLGSCGDADQPEQLPPTQPAHLAPPPPKVPSAHPAPPPPKVPPATVAITVHSKDYILAPMMSGHWYGGGYRQQVKGIPDFIRHPKPAGNMCQVYVEMPDGSGLIGNLLPLKAPPVKGIKIVHAAVKVENGFALIALMPIDPTKIPIKVVHTRLYVVTPDGRVLHGIITKKDIHNIHHAGHHDGKS